MWQVLIGIASFVIFELCTFGRVNQTHTLPDLLAAMTEQLIWGGVVGVIATAASSYLLCQAGSLAARPRRIVCTMSPLEAFVVVVDVLMACRYRRSHWRIVRDDPDSGELLATLDFSDYSFWQFRRILPHGRVEYSVMLQASIVPTAAGLTEVRLDWDVQIDPPIHHAPASHVCDEVSQAIERSLSMHPARITSSRARNR